MGLRVESNLGGRKFMIPKRVNNLLERISKNWQDGSVANTTKSLTVFGAVHSTKTEGVGKKELVGKDEPASNSMPIPCLALSWLETTKKVKTREQMLSLWL